MSRRPAVVGFAVVGPSTVVQTPVFPKILLARGTLNPSRPPCAGTNPWSGLYAELFPAQSYEPTHRGSDPQFRRKRTRTYGSEGEGAHSGRRASFPRDEARPP